MLLAHEDKIFQGALVASMSIPWGEIKGDDDIGGYHLVWTRDLVKSATALLASGATDTAARALIWLAVIQRPDGSFPKTAGSMARRSGRVCSSMKSLNPFCSRGAFIARSPAFLIRGS